MCKMFTLKIFSVGVEKREGVVFLSRKKKEKSAPMGWVKGHFGDNGIPGLARCRHSQPYSLGDSCDAASGYSSSWLRGKVVLCRHLRDVRDPSGSAVPA